MTIGDALGDDVSSPVWVQERGTSSKKPQSAFFCVLVVRHTLFSSHCWCGRLGQRGKRNESGRARRHRGCRLTSKGDAFLRILARAHTYELARSPVSLSITLAAVCSWGPDLYPRDQVFTTLGCRPDRPPTLGFGIRLRPCAVPDCFC